MPSSSSSSGGRLVKVAATGEDEVTGRLLAADEEGADLDVAGSPRRVAFADVTKAKVQIEFTKHEES